MKTEKIFKIVDEEWRLSLQSFTHSPDMNLRCRFYMTRNHSFKSVELMVWKRHERSLGLFLYSEKPLVASCPNSVREAKVQILKFLTEC